MLFCVVAREVTQMSVWKLLEPPWNFVFGAGFHLVCDRRRTRRRAT